jgi:hypothetical protein
VRDQNRKQLGELLGSQRRGGEVRRWRRGEKPRPMKNEQRSWNKKEGKARLMMAIWNPRRGEVEGGGIRSGGRQGGRRKSAKSKREITQNKK